jgi:ribonuclease R
VQAFADFPDGVSAHDLASYLELGPRSTKKVSDILNRLQSSGLIRRSAEVYRMARGGRVLVGVLRQRRRKTITFVPDQPDERRKGPIRLSPEDSGGAYDGDRVLVSVSRSMPGEIRSAKVEMLLRRGLLKIVGRLHHGFKESWVESLDEKFLFDIDLEGEGEVKGKGKGKGKGVVSEDEGSIVIVEIVSYPSGGRNPRGRLVEVLGFSDDPGMDIQIVIHKHDLPHIFPEEALIEAARVAIPVNEKLIEGRLDLRSVPTVTIDGETARDFDDAITLRKLENGHFDLGVHIADVSHYVKEGGALDSEARVRGTSVYFPERAIPMLPEELSNDICSLKPRVDRLTMSALMEVDEKGHVVSYELRETVIQSNERMTYTDVNKLLRHEDPQLAMRYAELIPLFRSMEELARVLIRMRERRGAIDFNLPEAVFEFDDEGRIAGVLKAERNIAHRIIEEFMLLANETVASHLNAQEVPSIYRIHEEPQPQRVLEFAELASAYGYRFPESHVSSKDYQNLSKQLEGKPEERVLAYAMLRSLERARYSARNAGHFGLAAPKYTHFTSPIRRYPDLLVHRLLKGTKKKQSDLELMAQDSSDRERAADAAEMEIDEWRKAKFMAERVGDEFDGTIVNVREFGFFVELDEFYIDGLVSLSSLGDDYYRYDERRHTLTGARRRRSFKLGDSVRVRVDRVNVDRHLVDFAVV